MEQGEKVSYTTAIVRVTDPSLLPNVRTRITKLGLGSFAFVDEFKQIYTVFLIINLALGLIGGVSLLIASLGIAIAALPVFRQYSDAMALLLVVVGVIMFSLQAVDNAHVLSMLSLSQQYAEAGGPDELFQTLAAVVGSTRRWAHYSELLVIDAWVFVLYRLLYRFRVVAAFGLITVHRNPVIVVHGLSQRDVDGRANGSEPHRSSVVDDGQGF